MTAPSSLPTITSSSGSHSLCEFTGEACSAGAASGPVVRVIMSMHEASEAYNSRGSWRFQRKAGCGRRAMSWRNLRQGWLVCVKSKGPEPLADSTEAVAPALTAAVATNQIDVAGISLAPRLFAAVRQNTNLRLVGDKQSLRPTE